MDLARSERGQVVVVDDVGAIPRTLSLVLKEKHEVTWFASSDEARDTLASNGWDLALIDIDLGQGVSTGIDCLSWIPRTNECGVVCMFTGHLSPELLHAALLAGADDYLVKTVEPEDLLREIDRLVALGRLPLEERPRYSPGRNHSACPGAGSSKKMEANDEQVRKATEQPAEPSAELDISRAPARRADRPLETARTNSGRAQPRGAPGRRKTRGTDNRIVDFQ